MKNIKVNYTNHENKRTSTTINKNIVKKLIFKEQPEWCKELLEDEDIINFCENETKILTKFAQKITNEYEDYMQKIECTVSQEKIEMHMLDKLCNHLIGQ